jgi:hypothetical protein
MVRLNLFASREDSLPQQALTIIDWTPFLCSSI